MRERWWKNDELEYPQSKHVRKRWRPFKYLNFTPQGSSCKHLCWTWQPPRSCYTRLSLSPDVVTIHNLLRMSAGCLPKSDLRHLIAVRVWVPVTKTMPAALIISRWDARDATTEKNVSQNHERRREQQQIKQKSKIPSNVFTNRITFCFQHDYAFALSAVCAWEK